MGYYWIYWVSPLTPTVIPSVTNSPPTLRARSTLSIQPDP